MARAAIGAGKWDVAASAVIAALQDLQGQKVSENDPLLEEFFAGDISEIMLGCHNESTQQTLAKWKFAVAQKVWERNGRQSGRRTKRLLRMPHMRESWKCEKKLD